MAYDSTTAELLRENSRLRAEIDGLAPDAERYRWHKRTNPAMLLANAWRSKAACTIGEDVDAATDIAMREFTPAEVVPWAEAAADIQAHGGKVVTPNAKLNGPQGPHER